MIMLVRDLRQILSLGLCHHRTWRHLAHYLIHGWSPTALWSLDYYVASRVAPLWPSFERLERATHEVDAEYDDILTNAHNALLAMQEDGEWGEDEFQEHFSNHLQKFWT